MYSKKIWLHSECIPNIRAHSCDRPECFYHAKHIRGAFEVAKYRTAFELHSDCILNILTGRYGIPTIFETFWSPSKETASHFKSCQNVPNAPRMSRNAPRMHFDCCRNLFRYYKNSAGMQFKCRRNLSIAARMRLEFSRNVPIGPRMSPDVIQNTAESHI